MLGLRGSQSTFLDQILIIDAFSFYWWFVNKKKIIDFLLSFRNYDYVRTTCKWHIAVFAMRFSGSVRAIDVNYCAAFLLLQYIYMHNVLARVSFSVGSANHGLITRDVQYIILGTYTVDTT